MGNAFSAFGGMFGPLHGLIGWLGHRPRHGEAVPPARQPMGRAPTARARTARPAVPARTCEKARRPLRVVRVVESGAPASAGRMFISGHMADVCAELDRLAALEAAAG